MRKKEYKNLSKKQFIDKIKRKLKNIKMNECKSTKKNE